VNPVLNDTLQENVNRTAISGENKVYKTNTEITAQKLQTSQTKDC